MAISVGLDGRGSFCWNVIRTKKNDEGDEISTMASADDAKLGCPDVHKIQFYGDPGNLCRAHEYMLMCMPHSQGTGGGDVSG